MENWLDTQGAKALSRICEVVRLDDLLAGPSIDKYDADHERSDRFSLLSV